MVTFFYYYPLFRNYIFDVCGYLFSIELLTASLIKYDLN